MAGYMAFSAWLQTPGRTDTRLVDHRRGYGTWSAVVARLLLSLNWTETQPGCWQHAGLPDMIDWTAESRCTRQQVLHSLRLSHRHKLHTDVIQSDRNDARLLKDSEPDFQEKRYQ